MQSSMQSRRAGTPGVTRAALALAAVLLAPPCLAADLRLGLAVETDTLDPHFHYFGGALALTSQIFDPLVATDADGTLVPALATAWRTVDDQTWEFDLRSGVRFSDGTPLTADDVAFTYGRARDVPKVVFSPLNPAAWEPLMEPARAAARRLVAAGSIVITQGGQIVDAFHSKRTHPFPTTLKPCESAALRACR